MPALSPQSVLDGRSTNRTPVPFIIGLVVCGLCMLVALAYYVLTGGVASTVVSGLLALPTVVVLVAMVLLIDRLEPEPRVNLLLAFGWGAGVAIVGSFIVNTVGGALLVPVFGEDTADLIASSAIAPVVEESFKGLLLLLLLWFRRFEIDGPTDGVVYAALCALGFAFVENVLYYQGGLIAEADSIGPMLLIRGVIAPLGHPIYTAMTGLGVAYAAAHRGFGRGFTVVLGWLAAVLLHSLWNFSSAFGVGGLVLAYLVELAVLVALVVVLVRDRRRLVALIGTHLPPYIPSGLVQPEDLRMLGTMSGRRRARHWARRQAGLPGVRAMGDYQLAATELALLHDHATRATIPVDKFHARRDAILVLMRVARDAFFQRTPQAGPPPWAPRSEQSGFFQPLTQLQTTRLPIYRPGNPGPGTPPPGMRAPGTPPPGTPAPGFGAPPPGAARPAPRPPQQGRPPAPPWQGPPR